MTTEQAEKPPLPRLVPELTPELLAESRENQAEWQKGVKLPDFVRDPEFNRVFIQKIELAELIRTHKALPPHDERSRMIGEQIAEILAANGMFMETMRWCPPGARVQLYAAYSNAERLPDDDKCEHYVGQFFGGGKRVENIYIERDHVPSQRYGKPVPILCCNVCGHRNMRPLTDDEAARFRM